MYFFILAVRRRIYLARIEVSGEMPTTSGNIHFCSNAALSGYSGVLYEYFFLSICCGCRRTVSTPLSFSFIGSRQYTERSRPTLLGIRSGQCLRVSAADIAFGVLETI